MLTIQEQYILNKMACHKTRLTKSVMGAEVLLNPGSMDSYWLLKKGTIDRLLEMGHIELNKYAFSRQRVFFKLSQPCNWLNIDSVSSSLHKQEVTHDKYNKGKFRVASKKPVGKTNIRKNKNEYQKRIWVYLKRKEQYKIKFGAKSKRYLEMRDGINRKLQIWRMQLSKMNTQIKSAREVHDLVSEYFHVSIIGRPKAHKLNVPKQVYYKYGMEAGIKGTTLSRFIGLKGAQVASTNRKRIIKNKDALKEYKSFLVFVNEKNKQNHTIMPKSKKMERKLVSSNEDEQSEVRGIADRFNIPIEKVREAILASGTNNKKGRSRSKIYAKLREMGFEIPVGKFKPVKTQPDDENPAPNEQSDHLDEPEG